MIRRFRRFAQIFKWRGQLRRDVDGDGDTDYPTASPGKLGLQGGGQFAKVFTLNRRV